MNLKPREIEIVRRLSEGQTVKEIALELGLSPKTIEFHRAKAQGKIGTNSVALLTRWALKTGITSLALLVCVAWSPVPMPSKAPTLAAALVPKGEVVPLGWDLPNERSDGIRIYASSNKVAWRLVATVEWTNRCDVSNVFYPQWFVARAFRSGLESADSNRLGLLGWQTGGVVDCETNSTLTGVWAKHLEVYRWTNGPGQASAKYFRQRITATKQRITE
jgi:DNA-binding CsgD family transcriptional regulator